VQHIATDDFGRVRTKQAIIEDAAGISASSAAEADGKA